MHLVRVAHSLVLNGEHCYLDSTDECYYMSLYNCRHRSTSRSFVLSLKRGYEPAITRAAAWLSLTLPQSWLQTCTIVPMPSSLRRDNPIARVVSHLDASDARDLLLQGCDTLSSHSGWRPSPDERAQLLYVNELATEPVPRIVLILDDVLTTGCHFRAAKKVLRRRWPAVRVVGVFLSRACSRSQQRCYSRDFCLETANLDSRDSALRDPPPL